MSSSARPSPSSFSSSSSASCRNGPDKARPSMGRALLANKRLRTVRRRRFCVPFCKGRNAKNARKPQGELPRIFFQSAFAGTALSALCKPPALSQSARFAGLSAPRRARCFRMRPTRGGVDSAARPCYDDTNRARGRGRQCAICSKACNWTVTSAFFPGGARARGLKRCCASAPSPSRCGRRSASCCVRGCWARPCSVMWGWASAMTVERCVHRGPHGS